MSDQQLNSLDRFRKQPGKLVLEEHSHCEVPAGCGGVVLRWRNPQATIPLTVSLYTSKEGGVFLDGVELTIARLNIAPGTHVLALALEGVDLGSGLLMFAGVYDDGQHREDESTVPVRLLSSADDSWRFTLQRPLDERWNQLEFDARDWDALVHVPIPEVAWGQFGASQYHRCAGQGAVPLGLAVSPILPEGNIWIRKQFTLAPLT
jgi:hypothetical protein